MPSQAIENYLKAIWKLLEESPEAVSTNSLANEVNISAASVTDMLKKMAKQRLINYIPYRGVTLTKQGRSTAVGIIRKHRLWELFLVNKLGFKWDEVHEIAEQLEHIQSETLTNRLEKFLDHPKSDPHGDPIPNQQGQFIGKASVVLTNLKIGQKAIFSGVRDHSPIFLQMLDQYKIVLGQEFNVQQINQYDQSLVIQIDSKRELYISHQIAAQLLVKKQHRKMVKS